MKRFIVVEGPIGVGKTSLAKRLAVDYGCELMLEDPGENPFLERFYLNRRQAALPTQLFFLLQRARQLQSLRQGDMFNPVRVADFMIEKDYLFAELNLDNHEFQLYQKIYTHLVSDVPMPDLVVYLQAPVEVLYRRISRRGRPYESEIEPSYLEDVSIAYTRFFHAFKGAPLLIVNAAVIDFMSNEADYQQLLAKIESTTRGRNYLNPAAQLG